MKFLLIAALLAPVANVAHATPTQHPKLSAACEAKLTKGVLKAELALLAGKGEKLASKFETTAYVNGLFKTEGYAAVVSLEDPADGRSVRYSARVSKEDVSSCNITLKRNDASYCRYSTGEGPDALNEIAGLKFVGGENIEAKGPYTETQKKQIREFLGSEEPSKTLEQLIGETDDGYLSTGTLTMPNGSTYDYFGAYGGDNPYGVFFVKGTIQAYAQNGDGSICLP